MKTADQTLEDNLTAFMSSLDPDLGTMRRLAGSFVALFTETALALFVLEYALRKKGLLEEDELTSALYDAQDALQRIRSRGGITRAGNA